MLLFLDLNVRYDPVVELGSYPEAVNTEGHAGKDHPNDPVADKASACAGKLEALAGDLAVLAEPVNRIGDSPRCSKTKGRANDEGSNERNRDTIQHATGKTRVFHDEVLL